MIFSLILGGALGAISVVFILQNTALVTVTFLSWQFEGSLAPILFLTIVSGMLIAVLLLLPSLVKETFYISRLKKQAKQLEGELTTTKRLLTDVTMRAHPAGPLERVEVTPLP